MKQIFINEINFLEEYRVIIRRILWTHFGGDLPDGSLESEDSWAHDIVLKPLLWKEKGEEMERWGKTGTENAFQA